MQLLISTDSIYLGSICRLSASSHNPFRVSPNSRILSFVKGVPTEREISSTEDKGKHAIEVEILDTLKEKGTGYGSDGSASRYGMSYFPFISSQFHLEISISAGLSNIIFEVPSNFRIIWKSAKAVSPSGQLSELSTSYSEKTSTYIFSWKEPQEEGKFTIDFDIRTGGPSLLKAAYFPIYYYLIALIAIAAAGTAEYTNVFLGAISAAWVFLLRHVNACDIPRRNVLLFYTTMILGFFLLVWGVTWRLNRFYHNEWVIACESLLAIAIVISGLRAVRLFESTGTLPLWVPQLLGKFIKMAENS